MLICSPAGGTEIEDLSLNNPDLIHKVGVSIDEEFSDLSLD